MTTTLADLIPDEDAPDPAAGIGDALGISRERVRTIEAAALRQLSVRPELAGLRRAA